MSDIVITEEQIEGWIQERAELEETIKELNTKLELINRRLEALRLFSGNASHTIDFTFKSPRDLTGPIVVFSVLERAGKPLKAGEVKKAVLETDYPREKWGKNFGYLYAVLSRLIETKKLMKHEGHYSLPFEEPEGDE